MSTDEDLLREWQRGSTGALEALVQRHHAPLLAHLTRLTGDVHLAEDLTQETFIRVVREAQAYRYPRPFKPWFYTIARHLARNHWQSAYHRHVTVDAATASVNQLDRDLDPAAWLERLEGRDRLQDAMRHLSFEQREVLSLRFGQELSVDETAAVVGVPAGTVKSRVFTALRRLRDQLDRMGARADEPLGDHQHG